MSELARILPEALKAAQTVFKSLNGRISSRLGAKWPPGPGAEILKTVRSFFADSLSALGELPFGIRIDPFQTGTGETLTVALLRDELMNGTGSVLFTVDAAFRVIEVKPLPGETEARTWLDMMQEESLCHPVFYFEQPNCVRVCGGGGLVNEFVPSTGEVAGRFNRVSRRAVNYREAIREHYEQWVKHGNGSDHWEDPEGRILRKRLGSAKKTEEIFQRSLIQWLGLAISDANIWPEPQKPNNDRADIKIQVFDGRFYMIEIKWMGSSGGTTVSRLKRLKDGLKQLKQYIDQHPKPAHATLVVYDARTDTEFEALIAAESPIEGMKRLAECENVKVPVGGCCFVFFLYGVRASQL